MSDNKQPDIEDGLESLLKETSTDRFAPFFSERVVTAIRQEEAAPISVLFAEQLLGRFRRIALPVAAACFVFAFYNLQVGSQSNLGMSANVLEAMFAIPPSNTEAVLEL